jgi:hypothetical protein
LEAVKAGLEAWACAGKKVIIADTRKRETNEKSERMRLILLTIL